MKRRRDYFKNPSREAKAPAPEKFVPQHKVLEKKPFDMVIPDLSPEQEIPALAFKKTGRNVPSFSPNNVPYAVPTLVAPTSYGALNVGNNMDHSLYTSYDMVDELGNTADLNGNFQDNNDFVNFPEDQLNMTSGLPSLKPEETMASSVAVSEYVIVMDGVMLKKGTLEEIEAVVKSLVFGDHPLTNGKQISSEDIVVFKRVSIKVGVFVD